MQPRSFDGDLGADEGGAGAVGDVPLNDAGLCRGDRGGEEDQDGTTEDGC
jgi:hypothetical protein